MPWSPEEVEELRAEVKRLEPMVDDYEKRQRPVVEAARVIEAAGSLTPQLWTDLCEAVRELDRQDGGRR